MTVHLLVVGDGRSPTARSWIKNIQSLGYSVSLISTYPCEPPESLKYFHVLPIAFSRFSTGSSEKSQPATKSGSFSLIRRFNPFFQSLRYFLGPLTLLWHAKAYRELLREIQPDLVHALRIPFEGMLASFTPRGIPCLAATWGNDLTLHAGASFLMQHFTRRCLKRTDGLTSDTQRDAALAHTWGLNPNAPTLVVPGSGGLNLEQIEQTSAFDADQYNIPKTGVWVVNPRGIRPGSVHQDVFFAAIPSVLAQHPNCQFICPGLTDNGQVQDWVATYHIQENTHLLPRLSQPALWSLMQEAEIFVSPSSHDGTPNTLLEAMACGCFPVVGDIESLREWLEEGINGLLVDPRNPDMLADAILTAIEDADLRNQAAILNRYLLEKRASTLATLPLIQAFYNQFS